MTMPTIKAIRKQIPREEFDYQILFGALKGYAHPRDKITDLLKKSVVKRVKKGLYVFGKDYRRRPYCRELLANLIYGPSYISLDYALSYYGIIPERVEAVTSVTTGQTKKFSTPVGLFTYHAIPLVAFQTGMDIVELENSTSYLIAVPEKALADKIRCDRGVPISSQKDMYSYLIEHLRCDQTILQRMNPGLIKDYGTLYESRKIKLLATLLMRLDKSRGGSHA